MHKLWLWLTRRVEVAVEPQDVVTGVRKSTQLCPVAKAIGRVTGQQDVAVGHQLVLLKDGRSMPLPSVVSKRIRIYDETGGMKPFRLAVPRSWVVASILILLIFALPAQAQFALPYRAQQDKINALQKQVNDLQMQLSMRQQTQPSPAPIIVMPPQQQAPVPQPIISPPLQQVPLGGQPYQQIPLGGAPYQRIDLGGQPYHLIPLGGQPFQQIQIGTQPYQLVPLSPPQQIILNPQQAQPTPAPPSQNIPLAPTPPKQNIPVGPPAPPGYTRYL